MEIPHVLQYRRNQNVERVVRRDNLSELWYGLVLLCASRCPLCCPGCVRNNVTRNVTLE